MKISRHIKRMLTGARKGYTNRIGINFIDGGRLSTLHVDKSRIGFTGAH
jgi:hypothetical protein